MLNLITMEKRFQFREAKMSEIGQFCHVLCAQITEQKMGRFSHGLCAQNTMEKLVPLSSG
jgi:hypothetical protein